MSSQTSADHDPKTVFLFEPTKEINSSGLSPSLNDDK